MAEKISSLTLDVRPGESLVMDGHRIRVELLHKSGRLARLKVTAPAGVKIQKSPALEEFKE